MKKNLNLLTLVFILIGFTACSNKQHIEKHTAHTNDCKHVHWSDHKGADGPAHWKDLCSEFSACGGTKQSPIDIVPANAKKMQDLSAPKFNYGKAKIDILNNGHTVEFVVSSNNHVVLNGNDYKLLQFHFHALSEHTIDGKHYPLEVHFVHKHSDSDYAVLALLIEEGAENPLFKKYLSHFPKKEGEYLSDEEIDLLSLFPDNMAYYNYNGSLTTPPCSEVVNWYLFAHPITASRKQIAKFSKILDDNYRPTQPLRHRVVKLYGE